MRRPQSAAEADLRGRAERLLARARVARRYDIGFPGATDLTFPELAELLTGQLLNNVGDPWDDGHGRNHTKHLEREVLDTVADLLRAPPVRWGYVTTGSTEGTLHALAEARASYPDAVVYTSAAAHYSVAKAARLLGLPLVRVPAARHGRMDPAGLEQALRRRPQRAAAVVATAGTTITEAIDDVALICEACDRAGVTRRRVHVDAALAGIPLALLPDGERPAFDFAAGATSMVVSGHKFLGTLMPCAVLVYALPPQAVRAVRVAYTGSADTTLTGSRSGHTPLLLWWALGTLGEQGLRRRAEASRDLAAYAYRQIRALGWPVHRNPHAFTVTFDEPPPAVRAKWVLASDGRTAHLVCMPGVGKDQIDEFVEDLRQAASHSAGGCLALARLPAPTPAAAPVRQGSVPAVRTTATAPAVRPG
jgi:histidine decarboxylase